jgi:antitoxin (DNA-binding transcriptional repressor) of toxin-antitoxin stability system
MILVQVDDAKAQLPDLINAAVRGETVLIEKAGEQGAQIVQLVAVPQRQRRQPRFGSAKGLIISMDDAFDTPSEDVREYME